MASRTVAEIEAALVKTRAAIDRLQDTKVQASTVSSRQVVRPAAEMFGLLLQREKDLCIELEQAKLEASGFPAGIPVKYGVPY